MIHSTMIVGVFDDVDRAETAARRLAAAGIAPDAMRIERTKFSGAASRSEARREGGTLRSFFAELFGIGAGKGDDDDDYPGHYAEAVRRGSSVLVVQAETDEQTGVVAGVLDDCGAIDIDARVEQWRGAGYARHDEQSEPYTAEQIAAERALALSRRLKSETTLPVGEENLNIGRRGVAGGSVRVHRRVPQAQFGTRVEARHARDTERRGEVEVENAMAAEDTPQRPRKPGGVVGGSVGTSGSGPSVRLEYRGPERRSRTPAAYSGAERRVAME